eukprot:TRINITY_DN3385_c0_g3_i1.p1 TRINITY_DN3385_c0_g3~~TRINITY_DN3385_c0_g3_i1.p1  ORF type:complete len:435 (+),score=95.06 TRINITY_DN3385_c0_g3_i1:31-1335(+)
MGNTSSSGTSDGHHGIAGTKSTYYHHPESPYDDLPYHHDDHEDNNKEGEFKMTRISLQDLLKEGDDLTSVGDVIVDALHRDSILFVQNTSEGQADMIALRDEAMKYFTLSKDDKMALGAPHQNDEGKRAYFSGYSQIHFENRDNRRDPEWRDVFQIRTSESDHIPWPSSSLKEAALRHYEHQWGLALLVLRAISASLRVPFSSLLSIAGLPHHRHDSEDDHEHHLHLYQHHDSSLSQNTNLCLFHYFDAHGYKTPQRCMVHCDHGLVTLLPKTDAAGLELLHPSIQRWVRVEEQARDDDVIMYCGLALQRVSRDRVLAATHRVVRLPEKERYSMPFEMKPNDDATIDNGTYRQTFKRMTEELAWKKIQRQVRRVDGIIPGSEEERVIMEREDEEAAKRRKEEASSCANEARKESDKIDITSHEVQQLIGTDMSA